MKRIFLPILIIYLLAGSCITKFTPEIGGNVHILVVEGLLTDEYHSNYVKLSMTRPVDIAGITSPVTNATIFIEDDLGTREYLTETKPGYYITDSLNFQAVWGRSYRLSVSSGQDIYETEFIEMLEVPDIDSLYWEFEYVDDDQIWPPLYSYQVYLNTYDPTNICTHFRWTYEEVWEYRLPFHYPPDSKRICWIASKSTEIMINNSSSLEEVFVDRMPLVYLDNRKTEKLRYKYSILAKQYSITPDEYLYWDRIKKLTGEVGGLYDPVPMAIEGNLHSTTDPSKTVLGYFSVSSVESTRLFIENDTIKMDFAGGYCVTDTLKTLENVAGIDRYIFVLEEVDGVGFLVSLWEKCANCTLFGTNIEPLYWNDDYK
ncbi:MAG: DUF4249 domain-containing protein [Bacteroidia bacterium]|nr:MAG: DUF4249 domain-containing protein [Bacteroidia bacterium]